MLVRKGTMVEMPIHASHRDARFFPDPNAFKPERFLKENAKNIIPFTFRPFGGIVNSRIIYSVVQKSGTIFKNKQLKN